MRDWMGWRLGVGVCFFVAAACSAGGGSDPMDASIDAAVGCPTGQVECSGECVQR